MLSNAIKNVSKKQSKIIESTVSWKNSHLRSNKLVVCRTPPLSSIWLMRLMKLRKYSGWLDKRKRIICQLSSFFVKLFILIHRIRVLMQSLKRLRGCYKGQQQLSNKNNQTSNNQSNLFSILATSTRKRVIIYKLVSTIKKALISSITQDKP